jgi:hypothetical protein
MTDKLSVAVGAGIAVAGVLVLGSWQASATPASGVALMHAIQKAEPVAIISQGTDVAASSAIGWTVMGTACLVGTGNVARYRAASMVRPSIRARGEGSYSPGDGRLA